MSGIQLPPPGVQVELNHPPSPVKVVSVPDHERMPLVPFSGDPDHPNVDQPSAKLTDQLPILVPSAWASWVVVTKVVMPTRSIPGITTLRVLTNRAAFNFKANFFFKNLLLQTKLCLLKPVR